MPAAARAVISFMADPPLGWLISVALNLKKVKCPKPRPWKPTPGRGWLTIVGFSDHSERRPQPIGNSAGDLCRGLVGDREHRTGVDLAKHVAVGPVGVGRAEHEVRVPDHLQVTPRDFQQGGQLRRPLVFHQPAQALEARVGIEGIEPRPGLRARGRRVDQGSDLLETEAGNAGFFILSQSGERPER